jgi:hypothetical protein
MQTFRLDYKGDVKLITVLPHQCLALNYKKVWPGSERNVKVIPAAVLKYSYLFNCALSFFERMGIFLHFHAFPSWSNKLHFDSEVTKRLI